MHFTSISSAPDALRRATVAVLLTSALLAPVLVHAQEDAVAEEPVTMSEEVANTDVISADIPADTIVAETPAETPVAPITPLRVPFSPEMLESSNYGMSIFVWNHPETTQRDLETLKLADVGWQKTLFQWREIEPSCKYCFDFREADRVVAESNKAGIKILARIDFSPNWTRKDGVWRNARPDNLQDFADFLRVFSDRYKTGSPHGHVHAIEIWNEPNLQREWGTPVSQQSAADYVQMLKMAYQTIKANDPSILVVTAGLSPTGWDDDTARPDDRFLQWMYDAGLQGNYDVLGVHGNAQAPDPLAEPGSLEGFGDASFYFRRIEQLRGIQEANGDDKPMWLLEFGWTSDPVHPEYSWFAVSEEQKASNLLAAMQYARVNWPWMQVMTIWTLPDPSWGDDREEYWWALANRDGTPRPALDLLVSTAQAGQLP